MYQPEGGILASELCIAAHIKAAQSHGAHFHAPEKVETWKVDDVTGIVTVFTDQGQYTARKLVLTAGSWMPDIMPELQVRNIILASILSGLFVPILLHTSGSVRWCPQGTLYLNSLTCLHSCFLKTTELHECLQLLQSAVVVERQVIGWFSVEHPDPDCCTPSGKFPVFLLQDETDYWYGFPQFGHNGLKIGKFHRGNNIIAHPKDLDRTVSLDDEQVGNLVIPQVCMQGNSGV